MQHLALHSVVALIVDLPEHQLIRGQVGTIVESWEPGVYEVEFSNDQGETYALVALREDQILPLHYSPGIAAA
ncbi:MAG: DUF4926 domain-containing protein [Bryobacter sp.]|nr:DUF4926 domain-containing protein [Bryobacter sp.]